jgi:hypothetical protein
VVSREEMGNNRTRNGTTYPKPGDVVPGSGLTRTVVEVTEMNGVPYVTYTTETSITWTAWQRWMKRSGEKTADGKRFK